MFAHAGTMSSTLLLPEQEASRVRMRGTLALSDPATAGRNRNDSDGSVICLHQMSRRAAASTIPVTNAAKQENSRRSFRTLVMARSPERRSPSTATPQRTGKAWCMTCTTCTTPRRKLMTSRTGRNMAQNSQGGLHGSWSALADFDRHACSCLGHGNRSMKPQRMGGHVDESPHPLRRRLGPHRF